MEIANTIYSGLTAYRVAVTTGVLGVAAFPTTALLLRLHAPGSERCARARRRGWARAPSFLLIQLSAGAFAYRWDPGLSLVSLSLFGLCCCVVLGPTKNSAGEQLPRVRIAVVAFWLEYLVVIVHLTAAARGLGGSSRFSQIAAMAVAGVGQVAATVLGNAIEGDAIEKKFQAS
jgi:hypothetical protein